MSTLDDIAQERQRLAERLAKIDGERARLAEQLAELEAAERVLSRFAQPRRRTGGPAATSAAGVPPRSGRRATTRQPAALSLDDATLRAVAACGEGAGGEGAGGEGAGGEGASAEDVRGYIEREFGMQVRPNHLGMALQRHRRAGRLEQRDSLWYPSRSRGAEGAA